jgi:hypothetical protein
VPSRIVSAMRGATSVALRLHAIRPDGVPRSKTIELWVRRSTREVFEVVESDLKDQFRPEWAKGGAAVRVAA